MKSLTILFFAIIAFTFSFAQKEKKSDRLLEPARGYYKQLAEIRPQPKSAGEEIDKQTFPYDAASAERRLSLKPVYLTNLTIKDFKLPEPPANSSPQTRAEINYLLGLQEQRTEDDVRASLFMANVYYKVRIQASDSDYAEVRRNLFYIGRSIGTWFNPEKLPITADLMANVWRDASYFIWLLKYKYARIRPYVIDSTLHNLEETNWAAYPSGHASNSYVNAYLYTELAPEFTDVFMKDGYDMAHSREIIGVHYPSDSESGRIFARQFVNYLLRNEKFLADFEKVKLEWKEKAKESFDIPRSGARETKKTSCAMTCE